MKTFKKFLTESSYDDFASDDLFENWFNEISKGMGSYDGVEYVFENFKDEYEQFKDMEDDEITNIPEFKEYMRTDFDERFDKFIYNIRRIIIDNNNKIPIYRVLTVNDKFFNHLETTTSPKLGIYWSWDENSAEAHWGDWKKPNSIIIHSEINENEVDWEATILLNINAITGEDEREIRLYNNTPLKILALVNHKTNQKYDISKIKDKTFRA